MIPKIIPQSRNGEVADVLDSTISAYKASTLATDPYLVAIFAELQPKSPLMIAAIERSKAESQLEAADIFRDDKIRGLFYCVQSALYNNEADLKAAAQKVDKLLRKYGLEVIYDSYVEESTLVKSLLNDLADPSLTEDIALIPGCASAIAQLKDAQDAFSTLSDSFEKVKSVEKQQKSASQLKKEIVNLINQKLVKYLNGMQAVNDTEYGTLVNHIAQIIADNNSRVKRRSENDEGDEKA